MIRKRIKMNKNINLQTKTYNLRVPNELYNKYQKLAEQKSQERLKLQSVNSMILEAMVDFLKKNKEINN